MDDDMVQEQSRKVEKNNPCNQEITDLKWLHEKRSKLNNMKNIFILLSMIGLLASCIDSVPSNHKGSIVVDKYTTSLTNNMKLVLEVDDYNSVLPYKRTIIIINVRKYYYDKYNIGYTIR